jgi:HlyD family secretion protein
MHLARTFASIVTIATLTACAPSAAPPGAPAPAGTNGGTGRKTAAIVVQVETSREGLLSVDNGAAGVLVADTQSSVAAGAAGTVQTLLKQAGDWVEAGDPVLRLDSSQLQLTLKIAQANLQNARITAGIREDGSTAADSKVMLQLKSAQTTYNSAVALNKIGGIAGSDFDTAQANLEAAKMAVQQAALAVDTAALQVQQAQLNLTYATIRAPYPGQISVINVHPGEYVSASSAAFVLVSRKKVINFSVAPSDAAGLSIGKAVKFVYAGKSYPTRVTQTPAAPVNGLVTLTAEVPAGLTGGLGTVGTIGYTVPLAQGTIVSLPALQSAENKTFVFTVNENKVSRVEVVILAESGAQAALSGLAGGSTVIVSPPPGLLVGATVQTAGTAAGAEGHQAPAGGAPADPAKKWSGKKRPATADQAPTGGQ